MERAVRIHLHPPWEISYQVIDRADVMGYSLGGRMTAWLALHRPERLRSAILGGIGIAMIEGGCPGENVARALEALRNSHAPDSWQRLLLEVVSMETADQARAF